MEYDNTNRGILSRNERKEKDSHPDTKGTINVNGVDYWLSGWTKTKKDGSGKFISLSIEPKQQITETKPSNKRTSKVEDMDDDDLSIPF